MRFLKLSLVTALLLATTITCADELPTWTPGDSPAFRRPLTELAGLVIPEGWQEQAEFEVLKYLGALPEHFDWRDVGKLAPVEDQGNCGSCWAFAVASTLQDRLKLTLPGAEWDISEQHLVSCNTMGYGCGGGFFKAHDMHVAPGSVSTDQMPYTASDSPCKTGLRYGERITSWKYVKSSGGVPSVDQLKAAIYLHGPIAVAVAADRAFTSYKKGVFNSCRGTQINHAVNLVGWDDRTRSWIMRNSWGASWGEQGFMRIRWGCNKIGYAANYIKHPSTPWE